MVARSGRRPTSPPGVYASLERRRRLAVNLLTWVSMFPAVTPKNRLGRPSTRKASTSVQSGWLMMPTVKPWSWSQRPMAATPQEGWST